MAYRKKTLRSMSPVTRRLARLIGELKSVDRRLQNLLPEISRLEFESRALETAKQNNGGYDDGRQEDNDFLTTT